MPGISRRNPFSGESATGDWFGQSTCVHNHLSEKPRWLPTEAQSVIVQNPVQNALRLPSVVTDWSPYA